MNKFRSYSIVILLIVIFVFAFPYVLGKFIQVEQPIWWNQVFDDSVFSALLWPHILHGSALFLTALPICFSTVWLFNEARLKIILVISIAIAMYFLIDVVRGFFFIGKFPPGYLLISYAVDLLKVFVIFPLAFYSVQCFTTLTSSKT